MEKTVNEYQKLPITNNTSLLLPLAEKYARSACLYAATYIKASLSSIQWKNLFWNLLERNSAHTSVYFDGSLQERNCVVGVWSLAFTLIVRLPEGCSILTAELCAIYNAVSFLSSKTGCYIIFSDSLSATRSLQAISRSSHYLIQRIVRTLTAAHLCNVVIEWIPRHKGIAENKKTDLPAKVAEQILIISEIALSATDIKALICKHYNKE